MADEKILASQILKTRQKDYVLEIKKSAEDGWWLALKTVHKDPTKNQAMEVPEDDFEKLMKLLSDVTRTLKKSRKKPSKDPRDARPEKARRPRTDEEAIAVGAAFHAGIPFKKMAMDHGRSAGAIRAQLTQMGLL